MEPVFYESKTTAKPGRISLHFWALIEGFGFRVTEIFSDFAGENAINWSLNAHG
jgi:hypothetical protein